MQNLKDFPEKELIGKEVTIKQYIGIPENEKGVVRGYDPKSKKWWVTNLNMPYMGDVTDWFTRDELIVEED